MTIALCPVYLFKSPGFAASGDTVVSVAPLDFVISVYGGGGVFGEGGVFSSFGGAVAFKNDVSDQYYIGVWGARNASRFRSELRAHRQIAIIKGAPDARPVLRTADNNRPQRSLPVEQLQQQ